MAISFVGSKSASAAGGANTTVTVNVALNSLNNAAGTTTAAAANDFCVLVVGFARNAGTLTYTAPSGWTAEPGLVQISSSRHFALYTKRMGATPDTNVAVSVHTNDGDIGIVATVQAYRGVHATTPNDVARVAITGNNPGAITPVTAGAWPIVCMAGGGSNTAFTNPGDLSSGTNHFASIGGTSGGGGGAQSGIGFKSDWVSGAFDPAEWTTAGTPYSVTLALRPAEVPTQALTPSLFTNTQTLYSPSLTKNYTVTPSLFTNTQTLYSPTLTSNYSLAPSLLTNTQTFYSISLYVFNPLYPPLLINEQTFYPSLLYLHNQHLKATLFSNNQTFYDLTVTPLAPYVPPPPKRGMPLNQYKAYKFVRNGDASYRPRRRRHRL